MIFGSQFRTAAVPAVVAVSLLCALPGCSTDLDQPPTAPPPVTSASASPTPTSTPSASFSPTPSSAARTLSDANLLQTKDVPGPAPSIQVEQVAAGQGRSPEEISICFPADAGNLGVTATKSRNFRFVLGDLEEEPGEEGAGGPDPKDPSIYTVVWQFADPASAQEALKTVQGWVSGCRKTLAASSEWRAIRAEQNSSKFHPVKLSGAGQGAWAEAPLYRAKSDKSDSGYFETVGLTSVEDRLMVIVDLLYGMDKITSDQQGGDPDNGVPADRQFALIEAAAKRLAG
jgi:hypothetical protein